MLIRTAVVAGLLLLFSAGLAAEQAEDEPGDVKSLRIAAPVEIDGVLSEECWSRNADVSGELLSFSPLFGSPLPFKTDLWFAHDGENLYFAIRANDSEPGLIKTSVTKRDNIDSDDWVGVALDPLGGRQSAYLFRVNPSGIQSDSHLTVADSDPAPDYVWESAARINSDGYSVEIKIPLKNFRYRSGRNVVMNVMLQRQLARSSIKACWPAKRPSDSILGAMRGVAYSGLERRSQLEVIPSFTYGALWDRLDPQNWSQADDQASFGVTAKYNVTSAISLEATVNPDFSQVESDEFQVLVNQRYPLFYQEKRPFFMESSNLFNLAASDGSGDYNMFSAVHTRVVVDPRWGIKLTGESGKAIFGLMAARDEWPELYGLPADYFMVGRLKWSLGADNFAGLLYSGRESDLEANRVVALDFSYKLAGRHHLSGKALFSSFSSDGNPKLDDLAYTLSWGYYTRPLSAFAVLEHVGEDFRMDTAFMLRSGIRRVMGYLAPSCYPRNLPWLKRLNFMLWGYLVRDYQTEKDDSLWFLALRSYFSQQASIRIDWRFFREYWGGKDLKGQYLFLFGQWQLSKRFFLYSSLELGDRILYDESDPLTGPGINWQFLALFQPSDKLELEGGYIYEKMKHPDTKQQIYDVNILRGKVTYQINRFLFLRGIVQYDSSQRIVLSDFLASFTLIPETVIHVGYGSAHQKMAWDGMEWQAGLSDSAYRQQRRSFFFKAGYRIQI